MFITGINPKDFLDWIKSEPVCDGVNHNWTHDEEDGPDEEYCARCFVVRGTEKEAE